MKKKTILTTGSLLAGLAVVIGAFGAHYLETILTENNRTETFETAVQYHFYHALALLIIGALIEKKSSALKKAAWFMIGGIVFFSGSLYVLSLTGMTFLGAITPIGGILFITGWILVAFGVLRRKS